MKKDVKIPTFSNDTDAAIFFDTHDSTEYISQTKSVNLSFSKPRHKVVVGLEEKQWEKLLKLASAKKLSYTRILEGLIAKQL